MPQAYLTLPSERVVGDPGDRRNQFRLPCDLTTVCQPAGDGTTHVLWVTDVRDVSEGGLCLSISDWVQPGSVLVVELPTPHDAGPANVPVRVVHSEPQPQGGWSLGCAFLDTLGADGRQAVTDLLAETARTVPQPTAADNSTACLVTIYPTGEVLGQRYVLEQRPLLVGRGERCDVHIPDHTVSRCHARIEPEGIGYRITDLDSTNGTFVNDSRVTEHRLADGEYLRLGGTIFRYLAGGNVEAQYHQELYRLGIYDGLTGIYNRRAFMDHLQRELARSTRQGAPLALVLFDIDHFKTINDCLGHLGGDLTLQQLVHRLKASIRKEEVFARYGGEEFAVLLPAASPEQAADLAERLRRLAADEPFHYDDQEYTVTISLGVGHTSGSPVPGPRDFIRQADEKLYQAKEQGRNRVVT